MNNHPTASAVVVLVVAFLGRFIFNIVKHRRRFRNLVSFEVSLDLSQGTVSWN